MGVISGIGLFGRKSSHPPFMNDWRERERSGADVEDRYPPIMYTKEGDELAERLWEETMEELNFAGASGIVQDMQRKE